jgi:hypothetical protein
MMVLSEIHSMVRSWKFIGILLVLGIPCFLACTREVGNVGTEYFYGDQRDHPVVFGRIGVVENGVEKSWGIPGRYAPNETSFQIFIKAKHSSLRVSHYLRGNGYFYLTMPPGEYTIWRWVYEFPGGRAITIEPLFVKFDVLPGKIVYTGTLYIRLPPVSPGPRGSFGVERSKPRYDIVDEYGIAMAFSKNQYPHFPQSRERNLMRFSH